MKKHNHTQVIYGLKVHTLNTEQAGIMDRYLMAFILCYLFGYDYKEMKDDPDAWGALTSAQFIKRVVSRVREDRGISEIWLHDLGLRYDEQENGVYLLHFYENWWEGRYAMLKCT